MTVNLFHRGSHTQKKKKKIVCKNLQPEGGRLNLKKKKKNALN